MEQPCFLVWVIIKYMDKLEMEQEQVLNVVLLRNMRNELLKETDKYLLPDFPISPEKLTIIKAYRQALRDFTNNNYILPDEPNYE
jgi:Phage tail assembly chaperone protein